MRKYLNVSCGVGARGSTMDQALVGNTPPERSTKRSKQSPLLRLQRGSRAIAAGQLRSLALGRDRRVIANPPRGKSPRTSVSDGALDLTTMNADVFEHPIVMLGDLLNGAPDAAPSCGRHEAGVQDYAELGRKLLPGRSAALSVLVDDRRAVA